MLEMESVDRAAVREKPEMEKMSMDLFAGTRSVPNVLEESGFTVITLDSECKYIADILENILT